MTEPEKKLLYGVILPLAVALIWWLSYADLRDCKGVVLEGGRYGEHRYCEEYGS